MIKRLIILSFLIGFTGQVYARDYLTVNEFRWTNNGCPAKYSITFKNMTKYSFSNVSYQISLFDKSSKLLKTTSWSFDGNLRGYGSRVVGGHTMKCDTKEKVETYFFELINADLIKN